jgi:trk system potassium uptake protein TrkH
VFEAVSGFTTTGATALVGLDDMPQSLLYYRYQIQWLGGIGMVVLAVALLPMLGIGGMQLLKAETPGPVKDSKLTPRITQTAKALWLVYVLITTPLVTAFLPCPPAAFPATTPAWRSTTIPPLKWWPSFSCFLAASTSRCIFWRGDA